MLTQTQYSSAPDALPIKVAQAAQKAASAAAGFSVTDPDAAGSTRTPEPTAVDKVFAKYDMTAISPREIDRIAAELQEAGFEDFDFLLTLMTHGEEFTKHLNETLAEAGYDVAPFDPTARRDLIADMVEQIQIARSFGAPTEHAEHFLEELREIQARAHPQGGAAGTAGTSGIAAQSIVLARAEAG